MPFEPLTGDDIFDCKKCGECCKGYGGTYVTERDIRNIARHIGTAPEEFVRNYCNLSGNKPVIAQKPDGYCIFWDEICTIHPVKPRMCKAWPFIRAVLTAPENWRMMANSCPGIRADVPEQELLKIVAAEIRKQEQDTETKTE